MWQLMSVQTPTISNQHLFTENAASPISRRISFLIVLFLITAVLTVASMYENFTNICIGFLFVIAVFFLIYSILIKTAGPDELTINSSQINDYIWTVGPVHHEFNEEEIYSRSPPSYESVMKDSKYINSFLPPPYSEVVKNQDLTEPHYVNSSTGINLNSSQMNKFVIIDASTLS